jgi:hypothetical protein
MVSFVFYCNCKASEVSRRKKVCVFASKKPPVYVGRIVIAFRYRVTYQYQVVALPLTITTITAFLLGPTILPGTQ